MPSHVRVMQNGDSHAIGRARLRLKLAALAYANSRHGIDADQGLSRAGLQVMCLAAIQYYEALTGADPNNRPNDPQLQLEDKW
jgi:hypothetical protein